jgi:SAM-dependent methyltransferase
VALSHWVSLSVLVALLVLLSIVVFFFVLTRGTLLMRRLHSQDNVDSAHVYPLYSNIHLIRLVDHQPLISAILLFQYKGLVSFITRSLRQLNLTDKKILITSCAFGNVLPKVVEAAIESGARDIAILDLIKNELTHAQNKLKNFNGNIEYLENNATATKLNNASVDANVIFFLLHELPHPLKIIVLQEAARVLAPGGKLYVAEFHRPTLWLMQALSWLYFKTFEPLSLTLWNTHDPLKILEARGEFTCERFTLLWGNFQVVVATKIRP